MVRAIKSSGATKDITNYPEESLEEKVIRL